MTEVVTYRREAGKLDMQAEPMLLNYGSPLMNNVGYAMAVEKLCGIDVTERCKYIRVLISEFSRIIDHMVCIGTNMVDLGALTNFWYFWKPREEVYMHLIEPLTGTRLTTGYTRIGGVGWGLPGGWGGRGRGGLAHVLLPAIAG